jgi:hypothetical protein
MKFTVLLISTLSLVICTSHAVDNAKYMPIAQGMMKFPAHPSEAEFRTIESRMAALPALDPKSNDDQHVLLISAAFLVGGHDGHHWVIGKNGQIGQAASDIVAGKGKIAEWARDDKEVSADKFDYWWMAYLGSQDEAYLFRVLKYAGDPTPYKDGRAVLVSLASWSFKSNCQQIKSVRDFAQRRLNDPAYKDRQEFLRSCLK